MNNKKQNDLKNLKYISISLMIFFSLFALLLPIPYEGKNSSLFFNIEIIMIEGIETEIKKSDILPIILFELLMLVCFAWSFTIFKFTNIPTIDDLQKSLVKMEIHNKISTNYSQTFISSLNEIKDKDLKELKENDLINAKKLQIEIDKKNDLLKQQLKEQKEQIKKLEKDAKQFNDFKKEIDEEDDDE